MMLAGVFLGLSTLTRLPNILECGLIVTVFYYDVLKKKEAKEIGKDVAACVAGFLGAFAAGFVAIGLQFGFGAYGDMLAGLSGYGATDASYSPFSMIASIAGSYVSAFYGAGACSASNIPFTGACFSGAWCCYMRRFGSVSGRFWIRSCSGGISCWRCSSF